MWWLALGFAQEFWSPNEVVGASRLFGRAQEEAGAVAGRLADGSRATSLALDDAGQSLDVLAALLPAGQRAALSEARARYAADTDALQGFADGWLTRFDDAFVSARERALVGHAWARCEGRVGGASRMPGFAGGGGARCEGTDRSAEVAAAMDADPALRAAVDALLAEAWPAMTPPQIQGAPVSFRTTVTPVASVDVSAWLRAVIPEPLQAIADRDALARERLADAPDPEAIRQLIADTVDARREAAAPWLELASAIELKKRGAPALAWCWVPQRLGGCGLPDATDATVAAWLADRKVVRALGR